MLTIILQQEIDMVHILILEHLELELAMELL